MLPLISFAVVATVIAVACLTRMLQRKLRERRGREEFERGEDSKNMIGRLREAFNAESLANLTADQSSQFS